MSNEAVKEIQSVNVAASGLKIPSRFKPKVIIKKGVLLASFPDSLNPSLWRLDILALSKATVNLQQIENGHYVIELKNAGISAERAEYDNEVAAKEAFQLLLARLGGKSSWRDWLDLAFKSCFVAFMVASGLIGAFIFVGGLLQPSNPAAISPQVSAIERPVTTPLPTDPDTAQPSHLDGPTGKAVDAETFFRNLAPQ
ncbi:MAG: hypothetical protein ACOYK8_03540 [Alphaproteobacteria bacterium]